VNGVAMKSEQSITSLPASPEEDRRRRMIQYTVAMAIRMVCVIICFFVHGIWLLVPLAAALILPSVAVMLANNVGATRSTKRVDVAHGVLVVPEPIRAVPMDDEK